MNQENEIEVLGFWWVLGHSEAKWAGQLKYSAERGAILQIFQNERHEEFDSWNQRYDVIYGVGDGKVYTLYNSRQISSSISNVHYYGFKTSLLFIHSSHYLENKEDMVFTGLGTKMNITNDFFRPLKSYNISYDHIESKRQYVIDENHQNIDFIINDSLVGNIYVGGNYSWRPYSFEISRGIWFWVKSKEDSSVSIDILLEQMNYLRMFFSIVLHGMCTYDEMEVTRPEFEGLMKLCLKNRFGQKHDDIMMFEYEKVEDKFSSILENWFRICREMPEVVQLFYNTYTSLSFYEYHFRDIYVALEGLCRWKLNQDTNGNIVPGLINPLIKRKLNVPSFIKIIDNYKVWGEIARKNRIYHTHLNKEMFADSLENNQGLIKLMRKIQAIILYYFLEELGLSENEIENVYIELEDHFLPTFY